MANNTSADAPKRNATAAEPMKTLSTTIQDVIKKAVTSPNDPKIDFAIYTFCSVISLTTFNFVDVI